MDSKSIVKHWRLAAVLIAAFALAFCLVGCGGQSGSSSAESSADASSEASASAESAAASDEASSASAESAASSESAEASSAEAEASGSSEAVEFNDTIEQNKELAEVSEIAKSIAENGVEDPTIEFNALPTTKDESLDVFKDFQINDSPRAANDGRLLAGGGIEMMIPSSWAVLSENDTYIFQNPSRTVGGDIMWANKKSGANYDYLGMAKALPSEVAKAGATNVTIIDYGTTTSARGTQCGAYVCFAATIQGTEGLFYSQFVGSNSYVNLVEFGGATNYFKSELDAIEASLATMRFRAGEEV